MEPPVIVAFFGERGPARVTIIRLAFRKLDDYHRLDFELRTLWQTGYTDC